MLKRAILCGAAAGLGVVLFYAIRFLIIAWMWSSILYGRDFMDASAKNGRGDLVTAETNFFGAPEHRSKSVIWLKRAGHWFSTTLIETRSWEVLIGLEWRGDDELDLRLDFGCGAETSRPVKAVGPVRIVYHWGDPGATPKIGYETFRRRDLPPETCPSFTRAASEPPRRIDIGP
ncbi:MAG TPA: hypothetical protein VFQ82_13120 [Stellaceae bacterium]|nr:hypothetical protein [Stellaceae bacterium]